jgi:hypothetical protein
MELADQKCCVVGTGKRTGSCAVLKGSTMELGVSKLCVQLVGYASVPNCACWRYRSARGSGWLAVLKTRTSLDEEQPNTSGWLPQLEYSQYDRKAGYLGQVGHSLFWKCNSLWGVRRLEREGVAGDPSSWRSEKLAWRSCPDRFGINLRATC